MISPAYCVMMARYNSWQNQCLRRAMAQLSEGDLTADRGSFFKSILGTANHLLWGDRMWMSRFSDVAPPDCPIPESPNLTPTSAAWEAERFRLDGRIELWAEGLHAVDLTGTLTWYSGALERETSKPYGLCVAHMFNHQTHHRGQIHAMLTAAGARTEDTDLFIMPDRDS
ncbi:DinB family protein [Pseudooceanicola sp. LIPI14-2-Ac024]|uniref:DinB family protein n=1 Tax=Pseudooceanicola sp. LIPI14-2-Ac024 TaxID=3344875 RepID=UPI0035D04D3F